MNLIEIGKITKTQGLKGEVRLKLWANDFNFFNNVNFVFVNNAKLVIEKIVNRNGFFVIKFVGINTIDDAIKLVNNEVSVTKSDIKLNKDEFFVDELINFDVYNEKNELLGLLTNINNYGATDIYYIKNNKEEFMFPFIEKVLIKIDLENKKIILKQDVLNEIIVR
jgi:16S rRNA processing protein RimM